MTEETITRLLADRIKRARGARGWTAQQLADGCARAGGATLTRGTIAKIESGARKSVTAEEIAVLAHVLGTTPTELLITPEWPFGPSAANTTLHLLVRVLPDAIEDGLAEVSSWRQDEPGTWPPARGESLLVRVGDLERHVVRIAADVEAAWAAHSGALALEMLLPRDLLDLPVHRWRQEPELGSGRPLALDFAVTVRSLERMQRREWHRRWRLRWSSMVGDPSPDRVYFAGPEDLEAPARFEAVLNDERWAAVALEGAMRELWLPAMRAGVPVAFWHPGPASVRDAVESLVERDGLADLPSRTRSARLAEDFAELVLLWDDPNRLVLGGGPGEPVRVPAMAG
ncbi:helix-turn-helix domain-containing protein [Amycolatopsis sp. NPDC004625]|uniref:VMAP-C domain-containing protein n=1 Tax=Amycolatopsis sp. NPDC004625 TaxID=3154670 RepID=UPI0033BF7241